MVTRLIISLLATIVLELLFALVWGIRKKEELLLVVLVNVVTNPVVVLLYHIAYYYFNSFLIPATAILEISAVVTEAFFYKNYSKVKRPVLFAVLINGFSYTVGVIFQMLPLDKILMIFS